MSAKSILITGCSSGIGLCAAKMLRERGYRVFAAARKEADVDTLKGLGLESLFLDVNDSGSIENALESVLSQTGGTLDALFNNAGVMLVGAIEDLTRDLNRAVFETNVFGPMELIQRVLPVMRKQGHGRIVQNSSILGIITMPFYGAYSASKFALEGFSDTLREELHGTNIHISIINPGPILSKLRDNAHQEFLRSMVQKDNVHWKTYQKMETNYFKEKNHRLALGPEAVVKNLIHALESRRPKAHYFVGRGISSLAFLRRILPDTALDWVLLKIARSNKPD